MLSASCRQGTLYNTEGSHTVSDKISDPKKVTFDTPPQKGTEYSKVKRRGIHCNLRTRVLMAEVK